jgi:hypothetical protein
MEFKSLFGPEDHNKNDKNDTKKSHRAPYEADPMARHRGALWAAVGLLTVALGAATVWGYEELEADRALFDGFDQSGAVDEVQIQVESIDGRLSKLVSHVATSDVVEAVSSRIASVERTLTRGLEATRADIAEVRDANADIEWRIQSTVEARTSPIRERLADLESSEQIRLAEIAALEEKLDGKLDDKLDGLRLELAFELAQIQQNEAAVTASFEQRMSGSERRLDIVGYAVEQDRIDFEMYEGYDEELSPGILLHLNQVDRRYQRIGGWIRLIPEGRIIRVKDQPIQEALVFFTHQDDRRHELVFTRVTESAAVGYINVPSDSFLETAGQDWNSPSVAVVAND